MKKNKILLVNFDPTIGSEMKKTRPCLVVSVDDVNQYSDRVLVAPITSKDHELPTHVRIKADTNNGLTVDSFIAVDQIRAIDKKRVIKPIGVISEDIELDVKEILRDLFDL
ncbi:MAG: type II toxin-antitoxin system PemK/MazF family toxin [Bacteroidales bacterium]